MDPQGEIGATCHMVCSIDAAVLADFHVVRFPLPDVCPMLGPWCFVQVAGASIRTQQGPEYMLQLYVLMGFGKPASKPQFGAPSGGRPPLNGPMYERSSSKA